MISFVNAKINIGLNIVGKRSDGYHLLETCFYPIGKYNGTAVNPEPFCDLLELTRGRCDKAQYCSNGIYYRFGDNPTDCPHEKNLIVRAGNLLCDNYREKTGNEAFGNGQELTLTLTKSIPDGAGLGGGSADATFTLRMLNDHLGNIFTEDELEKMAVRLGADCPLFVRNKPVFAEGIGEIFSTVESATVRSLVEKGYVALLVKPDLHISTAEAFAGIKPHNPDIPLRVALCLPLEEWEGKVINDFEKSLFPRYPVLPYLKEQLYKTGAIYASMTGSGAALYGIFRDRMSGLEAAARISAPFRTLCHL